ncbi:hypothetical protein SDC9_88708 [bioreactor metagenome]|uniref:Lipocalin-like domain-containing protein n=1 Tax=bioreactor metagenome TaxID=1076179 RepID=A0A644ZMP8_9ZZZZ
MKSIIRFSFLLIIVSLLFTACGKYEDGPKFSLMPKSARLINDWVIDAKYVNGTEDTLTDYDKAVTYSVQKDGKLEFIYSLGIISLTGTGTWAFSDSKESVVFSYSVSGTTYDQELVILRLTSKEFWGEETIEVGNISTVTEYHFVSK